MENIIFVNKDLKAINDEKKHEIGIRGRRAVELEEMGLPIAPGFILDSSLNSKFSEINIKGAYLAKYMQRYEIRTTVINSPTTVIFVD